MQRCSIRAGKLVSRARLSRGESLAREASLPALIELSESLACETTGKHSKAL